LSPAQVPDTVSGTDVGGTGLVEPHGGALVDRTGERQGGYVDAEVTHVVGLGAKGEAAHRRVQAVRPDDETEPAGGGSVEGDVAAIGGDVIQRAGARIDGDVIVLGGTYRTDDAQPNRKPEAMTIMYAGYQPELRDMMRNPTGLFSPRWTPTYLGTRFLVVLFPAFWGMATVVRGRWMIPTVAAFGIGFVVLSSWFMNWGYIF